VRGSRGASRVSGYGGVRGLEPADGEAYEACVAAHPAANAYHTLAWQRVIARTYRYRPRYLVAGHRGAIDGALPLFEVRTALGGRRLVGLPFSHHVPVLAADGETRRALVAAAQAAAAGSRYLELRHGEPLAEAGEGSIVDRAACHDTRLDLTPEVEVLRAGLHPSQVRRAVSKAERGGIEVVHSSAVEDFRAYHELQLETRRRQGAPPYPARFFDILREELATRGLARLWLARHEGRLLAGIVVLTHGRSAIYGYGASTRDPELIRLRPNHLLFWRAILDARERGYRWFDFGSTPLGHDSLLRFKQGWGGETRVLSYQLAGAADRGSTEREGPLAKLGSAVLRRMPMTLFRTLGPMLMRQLG
jgi:CelD/BcsL family acetyltransferase involved in cellulose biosynthesis